MSISKAQALGIVFRKSVNICLSVSLKGALGGFGDVNVNEYITHMTPTFSNDLLRHLKHS